MTNCYTDSYATYDIYRDIRNIVTFQRFSDYIESK